MYSDPHFPVELPGIEPGLLPGEMLSELQFHYRLDPLQSRSLPVGSFSGLDGVKSGQLTAASCRLHHPERRRRPAELDNAVPSGWHLREQPEGHTPADGEAGVSRVENLSSDFYDHLALCTPLLDVGQSFGGRFERKDPIYNGTNSTGIDEGAELA